MPYVPTMFAIPLIQQALQYFNYICHWRWQGVCMASHIMVSDGWYCQFWTLFMLGINAQVMLILLQRFILASGLLM